MILPREVIVTAATVLPAVKKTLTNLCARDSHARALRLRSNLVSKSRGLFFNVDVCDFREE